MNKITLFIYVFGLMISTNALASDNLASTDDKMKNQNLEELMAVTLPAPKLDLKKKRLFPLRKKNHKATKSAPANSDYSEFNEEIDVFTIKLPE